MMAINYLNLWIYRVYFFVCYLIALVFSAICFNLIAYFYQKHLLLPCCAATFMTFVFYISADAADILGDVFSEKIRTMQSTMK